MWSWIIKVTMVSLLFIFLLHYLYSFFKTTLTSPKLKDLVNKPQEKYNTIYNSLKSTGDGGNIHTREDNNTNSSVMKDELKRYLKELNFSDTSNSNSNSNTNSISCSNTNTNTNTNTENISSYSVVTDSIYSPNNMMTDVGANGISTRVNNMPNYMPNINAVNTNIVPDYGTPSMSSSYASAYSTY